MSKLFPIIRRMRRPLVMEHLESPKPDAVAAVVPLVETVLASPPASVVLPPQTAKPIHAKREPK